MMRFRSMIAYAARWATSSFLMPLAWLLMVLQPAPAQTTNDRFGLASTFNGGLLVGGSDDYLDDGFGVEGSFTYRLLKARYLWLRADIGYLSTSAIEDPESGAMIDNNMLNFFAGPELTYPIWRFEPFLRGYVGMTLNRLSVSGSGDADLDETDTVFSYGFGPGLRFILSQSAHPLSIELSARLIRTGDLDFASSFAPREPGVRERDIAILMLGLGLRIGLP